MKIESGSTRMRRSKWYGPAVSQRQRVDGCERSSGESPEQPDEAHDRRDERDADGGRRHEARPAPAQPLSGERDRERRAEGREQADPGGGDHPRRVLELVDVEVEVAPGHRDDQAEPDDDLGGRDGHHGQREDLAVTASVEAGERDQGEVRAVEHELEREQHDQRAAADQHAERSREEQERRDAEVPDDRRAVHSSASANGCSREWLPRITPPTAATSRTIEVISNASRWSVRKSRPIVDGLPKK